MIKLPFLIKKTAGKWMLLTIMLTFVLIGCVDSANYAIFRESLDPLRSEVAVGMSANELETLLDADYSEVVLHEYAFSSEHSNDFGLDPEKEIDGEIYQMTMSGDPAEKGVSSICFFKVLLVDDGGGEMHVIEVADVSCPA